MITLDQLHHGVTDAITLITSSPTHLWFTVGVVAASLPVTAVIVEWVKRHHFKVNSVELENEVIDFTVLVTGTLMTLADFLITNGTNLARLLPFLAVVLPTIKAFAPSVYTYSKAIHGWFINRKAENQKQRIQALGNKIDTALNGTSNTTAPPDLQATSVQTAPAPQPQPQPSDALFD